MVLAPGIEPRLADSKSAVLPLDEARMGGPRSPSRTGLYGFSDHRNDRACSPGELLFKLDVPINVRLVV